MAKQQKREEEKKSRKALLVFFMLLASGIVLTGSLIAFFSDYITGSGNATSGTLDIQGTYTYWQNGAQVTPPINNLNPGDVIVVKATVTNAGNKSAWIQNVIDLTGTNAAILPYLKVCAGERTYATCSTYLTLTSNAAASTDINNDGFADVLNGTGTGAESETNGIAAAGLAVAYTIKFDTMAPNAAQGKTVAIAARTNAIQYRNNATPSWANVGTDVDGSGALNGTENTTGAGLEQL